MRQIAAPQIGDRHTSYWGRNPQARIFTGTSARVGKPKHLLTNF